jgi:hypothetical protein
MAKSGICGEAGKTYLINPNLLFGQEAGDNLFVPVEDLNIYVELTTTRKNRSILDVTDDGLIGTSTEKGKSRVSFIDGSITGKKQDGSERKSLTTSYTDLTTVFNKTADTEKFGITNIDIDFNSSYAPLVNIKFVDIRGASLFNTGNPPNSEYASFFDLPYPIFELKVKGYYGKTVKYCLHLVRWNAAFNSETGNFEIDADFIGYTYALLTDMLLGYLRAIVETPRGKAKFAEIKATMKNQSELITVNELLDKIVNVNEAIVKLQDDDTDLINLTLNNEVKSALDGLENLLKSGVSTIRDTTNSSLTAGYAALDSGDGLIGIRSTTENSDEIKLNETDLNNFKDAMSSQVGKLNDSLSDGSKVQVTDFTDIKLYSNFNYNKIMSGTTENNVDQLNFRNTWGLQSYGDFEAFKNRMFSLREPDRNINLYLYDFKKTYDKINELKNTLKSDEEKLKKQVGQKISKTFIDVIGFEPTIRNLFRIFTIHAEVFMECLKDVSLKAETDEFKLRRTELEKLNDKFDIHPSETSTDGALPPKIWPWPLYRRPSTSENKNNTLEEAYLGEDVEIDQNVPELQFVEELLEGLLAVARGDLDRQERIDNPDVIVDSWFPVNVTDTPLFGVIENPYKKPTIGNSNNPTDPLKLMVMRAFTFMGLSNRTILQEEIDCMSALEANSCYEGVQNETVRLAMFGDSSRSADAIADDIIKWFIDGKGSTRNITLKKKRKAENQDNEDGNKVMVEYTSPAGDTYYEYILIKSDYITDNNWSWDRNIPYIPINGNYEGEEFYKQDGAEVGKPNTIQYLRENSAAYKSDYKGNLFLGTSPASINDGALQLKIFSEQEYNNNAKALRPNYVNQVDRIQKLIQAITASAQEHNPSGFLDTGGLYQNSRTDEKDPFGFNILGGDNAKYAFTTIEFVDINEDENSGGDAGERAWSVPINNIPAATLKSAFYVSHTAKYGATCLSKKRNKKSPIEVGVKKINQKLSDGSQQTSEFYRLGYYGVGVRPFDDNVVAASHPDLGKNRELFNESQLFIPFVDYVVTQRKGNNYYQSWSLFGSRWYYEQRRSSSPKSAKALLFLHTLPWNQLYTDNSVSDGVDAGMFDNDEGYTISNIFNRKSAFINTPYLWAAFIGGMIWRWQGSDIIYEDDNSGYPDSSGKVPSYRGGSGSYDPIVWGERINQNSAQSNYSYSYLNEFNLHYGTNIPNTAFPAQNQFLTAWSADAPLELDTDGKYKFIERLILDLPTQIKSEFKRIFFEFVNSKEWETIRKTFEVQDLAWDEPNTTSGVVWDKDGSNNANWTNGSNSWKTRWESIANLTSDSVVHANDGLIWEPEHEETYEEQNSGKAAIYNSTSTKTKTIESRVYGIKKNKLESFRNWQNWGSFGPVYQRSDTSGKPEGDITTELLKYNYDMELRDNAANQTIVDLFRRGVWLASASYKPWVSYSYTTPSGTKKNGAKAQDFRRDKILVRQSALKDYIKSFVTEFKRLNEMDVKGNEEDALKEQLFNTMDSNVIRLNIYRHCKSLYDKWIAGSGGNILYACGSRNKKIDKATATKERDGNPRLIDSFRFVNRAFNDIGNEYLINPLAISDIVVGNMNQSFYDLISRVLSDNNFNFIALPSYIDFSSKNEMEAIFKPEIYSDTLADDVAGPTFVCVYVGQTSNKLDLGKGSAFPNDGFDFRCDDNGNLMTGEGGLPNDFTKERGENEHNVVAFAVNYGHQNQNIFTDVRLDQKEFAETDESLQITDDIAKNASQSDRTQAGQNLWNVYQVRSYSTEVTALGNAMLQPMMYFQLNNIPMFHGAYMIIHTKHKITPNHMKTTFKGVRTRYVDTPLIDSDTLYMSMIGSLSDVDGSKYTVGDAQFNGGNRSADGGGSFAPIVNTIRDNGGQNGKINTGNITTKTIPLVGGVKNFKLGTSENILLSEAIPPLVKMLNAWVKWMKSNGFSGSDGNYAYITSVFRDYEKQVEIKKEYGSAAATPGTSPHGWGIAIDLQFFKKNGTLIPNKKNSINAFDTDFNPAIKWLYDNSYVYGFVLPFGLRNGNGLEEHWHFEYHGTSAKCLISENPDIYGYKVDTSKAIDSSVVNPKDKNGEVSTYSGCKYTSIKTGDGTESDTELDDSELANNQKVVKDFFKGRGYTRAQVAAIMGNIQQESKFNPFALNKRDRNGFSSFGLIQWNTKYTTKEAVGNTLQEQLNYLDNMNSFKSFISDTATNKNLDHVSFYFAKGVEKCHLCTTDFNTYRDSYQYKRNKYAADFYNRFTDSADALHW